MVHVAASCAMMFLSRLALHTWVPTAASASTVSVCARSDRTRRPSSIEYTQICAQAARGRARGALVHFQLETEEAARPVLGAGWLQRLTWPPSQPHHTLEPCSVMHLTAACGRHTRARARTQAGSVRAAARAPPRPAPAQRESRSSLPQGVRAHYSRLPPSTRMLWPLLSICPVPLASGQAYTVASADPDQILPAPPPDRPMGVSSKQSTCKANSVPST